jgi:hypothetical protein
MASRGLPENIVNISNLYYWQDPGWTKKFESINGLFFGSFFHLLP